MPHRFIVLERIAFSLFTLSAVLDAGYISWEKSPNLRENVQQIVEVSKEVSLMYPPVTNDQWMPLAAN